MQDVQLRVGMPLADFIRENDHQPFELIQGEKVPKMPTVAGHNETLHIVFQLLVAFVTSRLLGLVRMESTFILPDSDDQDWVKGSRTPDILFFAAERLAAYKTARPDWRSRPYAMVPDLVIEIVSPNDSYSDLDAKADLYLADGVRTVWAVDPQRRTVRVYTDAGEYRLKGDDVLYGGDVVPGFETAISAFFQESE
ncbi:MAG: Uma2 family endonuclease [bacterium]|nr:Uma2 family endonuclease [bacterium]